MGNKVNYKQEINLLNLFHTPRDQGISKSKVESKKMGLQFFLMILHGCSSFLLSRISNI